MKEESLNLQNKINYDMISKTLTQYRQKLIEEFEKDWLKFSKDLHKYELRRTEFKDWSIQQTSFGK